MRALDLGGVTTELSDVDAIACIADGFAVTVASSVGRPRACVQPARRARPAPPGQRQSTGPAAHPSQGTLE